MARLLEKKDPDSKDSSDRTPLYYATEKGNVQLVKLLLGYDVDVNSECGEEKWKPLSQAIKEVP